MFRSVGWAIRALSLSAVLALGVISPVVAAQPDPFKGSWSAIDLDGSRMTLTFEGSGPTRSVTFVDHRTTCAGGDPVTAVSVGTIEGSSISGEFSEICGLISGYEITHDPLTNTLSGLDVTWRRGDAGPDAFSGVWVAMDLDGSAMQLTLDGSALSRDVVLPDRGASICGDVVDGEGIDWVGSGAGTIGSTLGLGRFLFVTLSGSCQGSDEVTVSDVSFEYVHDTNQLMDNTGVAWSRRS
jgi:hypothetical protein